MWKKKVKYPYFVDPLYDWVIELSSNKTANTKVAQYKSIQAIDQQGDQIISTFNFDGNRYFKGISNMNNGTFTLLVDTKKMETLAKEFYAYVQLEDDKGNKSPISMRMMVRVVIKDMPRPK